MGGAEAAVVAVVGDAEDQAAFLALVESGFYDRQFEVVSLEDVEPLALRKTRHQLSAELSATIAALSSDSLLAFGTFHTYKRYVGPVNHIPIVEPKP